MKKKMKKTIKKKWLAALRSGKYKQGKKMLRTSDDCFCCLGVLCDIYAKQKHLRWRKSHGKKTIAKEAFYLPELVYKWAGLPDENPVCYGANLSVYNDRGDSFIAIADKIEKYL